jgi:hypothetical protein
MLQSLCPQGKLQRYPLDRRLSGPQSRSVRRGKEIFYPTGTRRPIPRSSSLTNRYTDYASPETKIWPKMLLIHNSMWLTLTTLSWKLNWLVLGLSLLVVEYRTAVKSVWNIQRGLYILFISITLPWKRDRLMFPRKLEDPDAATCRRCTHEDTTMY